MIQMVCGQGNLAQSGANFLQIAPEPRGAALGGGVTADCSGAAALYWNPAGALNANKVDMNLSHTDWFMDTRLTYGAVVFSLSEQSALGFKVLSFGMDETEITTVYQPDGTNEFYKVSDISVGFSYIRALSNRFTLGISTNYIREAIWNEETSQIAFDVGSLYSADFMNLKLGMSARNLSGKLQFEGDDIEDRIEEELLLDEDNNPRIERFLPGFRLPQVFHIGVVLEPMETDQGVLKVLADVDVPSDNRERITLGTEYGYQGLAYLRLAMRINDDTEKFSLGGGLNLSTETGVYGLDYSLSSHEYFGTVHRFGVSIGI